MALAINNNTIMNSPINQSFDLDEVLAIMTTRRSTGTSSTPEEEDRQQKIEDTKRNSDQLILLVSNLPTVNNIAAATGAGVCTVCMEDFHQQQAFPCKQAPCGHVFHATCISTWISISNSCPVCRSGVTGS